MRDVKTLKNVSLPTNNRKRQRLNINSCANSKKVRKTFVHVLGESVEKSADRSDVKERHWTANNLPKHSIM